MSAEATAWAKRQKTGDATRKAILRALADYAGPGKADRDAPAEADGRHFTFVGVETIAEECECSERTVIRHLNELKARAMIVRVRRMRGFVRTSDYTILAVDGAGDRPFTEEEAVLAEATGEADVIPASTGATCSSDNLADANMADVGACHPEQANVTPAAPAVHDAGVTCVPYTGTSSNPEPPADPPAAREPERDDFSPMLLTEPSGHGVLSRQTQTTGDLARAFYAETKRVTEEIMSSYSSWFLRETGEELSPTEARKISQVVNGLVNERSEGADIRRTRDAIAAGLGRWTLSNSFSAKQIPDFVLLAKRESATPRPTSPPKPTRADERRQRLTEAVAAATGDRDLLARVREQGARAGFGSTAAFAAIEGRLA